MLGACPGGGGQPYGSQHCDTRKGDQDLRWNPADPDRDVALRLSYRIDGAVVSDDCEFDRQLNDALNLNLPMLKQRRKSVLDAVLEWWRHERNRRSRPRTANANRTQDGQVYSGCRGTHSVLSGSGLVAATETRKDLVKIARHGNGFRGSHRNTPTIAPDGQCQGDVRTKETRHEQTLDRDRRTRG